MPAAPARPPRSTAPATVPTVRSWRRRDGIPSLRRNQITFLTAAAGAYGDIFRFRRLGFPLIAVNHPDYVQHVLVDGRDNYDKAALIFKTVRPVLRNGLIPNPGGAHWARQRRLMQPSFRPATVTRFTTNMTDEAEALLRRWDADPGPGGVVNLSDQLGQMALRIVNRSLFSADVSATAEGFARAFLVANEEFARFFRFPFPPLGAPTPSRRRMRAAIATMDGFVAGFIRQRAAGGAHDDLLAMLMAAVDEEGDGQGMDTAQLHDEVLNLVIGAYETTTNALSWAFWLLARHPEVERQFHDEVDRLPGGRVPTAEDLPRLAYTRMIVDETLRLYSPAWQTMRRARAADQIGGYHIPAHANIYLNSYLLHRHPGFWDDPEVFDPLRFTPERVTARPRHAYLPFGSGPRVCIGKHFALAEITLVMATIGRRYRLPLPDDAPEVEPLPLITLHPKGGVPARLERRPDR